MTIKILKKLYSEKHRYALILALPFLLVGTVSIELALCYALLLSTAVVISSLLLHLLQPIISHNKRFLIYSIVCAFVVSLIQTVLSLWFYELSVTVGIYVAVIAMSSLMFFMLDENNSGKNLKSLMAELTVFTLLLMMVFLIFGVLRQLVSLSLVYTLPGGLILAGLLLALVNYFSFRSGKT